MATTAENASEFIAWLRRVAERIERDGWGVRWFAYDWANDIAEGEPVRDEAGDLWATNHSTGHQHVTFAVELERPDAEPASEGWETLEQAQMDDRRGL